MYQFKIIHQPEGGHKFELGEIKMFVENYTVKNDKHLLTAPGNAIAYFNVNNNIYGISNYPLHFDTAEEFFDAITQQYQIITGNTITPENLQLTA